MPFSKNLTWPDRLPALVVLSTAAMLAAIGWLGWRLLIQERALDEQRLRNQLENTAALASHELDGALDAWVDRLPAILDGKDRNSPPSSVTLRFDAHGVLQRAGLALPFYPVVPQPAGAEPSLFSEPETLEFSRHDLQGAERVYRRMAASPDRAEKAGALLRLARVLRHEQRTYDAIATYGELASVGPDVWVAGSPAELVARRERMALFEAIGDRTSAEQEATSLSDGLWSGRQAIDRAIFDFYREATPPRATMADRLSLAEHLEAIWPTLQKQDSGRLAIANGQTPLFAVWRKTNDHSAVMVSTLEPVSAILSALSLQGLTIVLQDDVGHLVWGNATEGATSAVRTSRQTGLPWTLRVAQTDSSATQQLLRSRRTLLTLALFLTLAVVVTAGVAMYKAASHELNVARLQSDFVATVSHEFRTPLTAMRHLTEMLDEGEVDRERVPQYYKALVKETRRLQSLVESLLDFGRMEAGRRTYRMEECDACDVVRQVLDDLSDSVHGCRIEWNPVRAPGARAPVRVDREAMGLAVRNLVDNALKYSPESAPVRVSVGADSTAATISVADRGPGIADGEQREIFRKFVRGAAALDGRVNGTGIGLAIADHIVQAHGGQLRLESAPGQGSCFSIVLPLVAEAA